MDIIERFIAWGPHGPFDGEVHSPELNDTIEIYIREHIDFPGVYLMSRLLRLYSPKIEDQGISLVPDHKSRRTNPTKPGRAFRKMFPELPDTVVESLTTKVKDQFFADTSSWTYETTEDARTIGEIYQLPCGPQATFYTDSDIKNLSNSCMRYDFDHLECHPASAWGSGDFVLHYVTNADGDLMARTLIRKKDGTRGPIYAVCMPAVNFLKEKTGNPPDADTWEGAQILAIPHSDDLMVGPYCDVQPQQYDWDGSSDLMTIKAGGNVNGEDHEGLLTYEPATCDYCGTHLSRDEDDLCESCVDLDLVRCERTFQMVPAEDTVEVHHRGNLSQIVYTETWSLSAVNIFSAVQTIDGTYWRATQCTRDHRGNWVPDHLLADGTYTLNPELQVFEHA